MYIIETYGKIYGEYFYCNDFIYKLKGLNYFPPPLACNAFLSSPSTKYCVQHIWKIRTPGKFLQSKAEFTEWPQWSTNFDFFLFLSFLILPLKQITPLIMIEDIGYKWLQQITNNEGILLVLLFILFLIVENLKT